MPAVSWCFRIFGLPKVFSRPFSFPFLQRLDWSVSVLPLEFVFIVSTNNSSCIWPVARRNLHDSDDILSSDHQHDQCKRGASHLCWGLLWARNVSLLVCWSQLHLPYLWLLWLLHFHHQFDCVYIHWRKFARIVHLAIELDQRDYCQAESGQENEGRSHPQRIFATSIKFHWAQGGSTHLLRLMLLRTKISFDSTIDC